MAKKVLIIGFVWPEPKSSAAGSRMMQLIEAFQSNSYEVIFASPCAKTDNAFDLNSINVVPVEIMLNSATFDDFVKKLRPEVVMFDRFMMEEQFGWRVAEHCPSALRILDTEDLHCLRKGRGRAIKEGKSFSKAYLFHDIAKREIASIFRCDLSLIISEAEMELLQNEFKIDKALLHYVPFMIASTEETSQLSKFEEREHFVTIGNFLHEPNYKSVIYLKEHIWPFISKQLPEVKMHVYGAYASDKVHQLHNEKERFLVKGFAEDVNEIMQKSRVCLAPLQFGAGLKGKLIDAMVNGTPCVTTSIGAEGMFGDLEPNGFIEDDSQNFANIATELYTNKDIWIECQANGFQVISNRFRKSTLSRKLISRVEKILEELEEHRLNNFIGSMLQHHSMQSTKFMSRWIEEKNKQV
ncbi:glycosyltransferase family 4 protein [Flavobacteriaceae sp. LMIT009]